MPRPTTKAARERIARVRASNGLLLDQWMAVQISRAKSIAQRRYYKPYVEQDEKTRKDIDKCLSAHASLAALDAKALDSGSTDVVTLSARLFYSALDDILHQSLVKRIRCMTRGSRMHLVNCILNNVCTAKDARDLHSAICSLPYHQEIHCHYDDTRTKAHCLYVHWLTDNGKVFFITDMKKYMVQENITVIAEKLNTVLVKIPDLRSYQDTPYAHWIVIDAASLTRVCLEEALSFRLNM